MNERIKLLAEQARKALATDAMMGGDFNMNAYEQKFAQLIAMDCMSICEELGDKGLDGHYCADEIKKQFGVKV